MSKTKQLVTGALLLALQIVLARYLSIDTTLLKMNFGFVPIAMAGIIGGCPMAVSVGLLGDLLGIFLFSKGGTFHPGFTLTAALNGLTYGFFLHSKKKELVGKTVLYRSIICAFIINGPISIGLNSLWLTHLYGTAFVMTGIPARIGYNILIMGVQIAILPTLVTIKRRIMGQTSLETEVA